LAIAGPREDSASSRAGAQARGSLQPASGVGPRPIENKLGPPRASINDAMPLESVNGDASGMNRLHSCGARRSRRSCRDRLSTDPAG
jgi:hypothetical protein